MTRSAPDDVLVLLEFASPARAARWSSIDDRVMGAASYLAPFGTAVDGYTVRIPFELARIGAYG